MRIHIGQISDSLAESISDLESRLDRFGRRTGPLSLHRKEFGDHHFAFVDMELDAKQFAALSRALNGMMFRQSKLEVNEAQPSFQERMQKLDSEKTPVKLNPEQKKRLLSGPNRQIDVYKGRMRDSGPIRMDPTFRVKIKGELRKPKMRKRKLWGIEKRPLNKLVSYFADGEWRDSEDRAVEIVDALHDEHAQAERIAADFANSTAYLSDSDFDEFKENANQLEEVDSDDEIEVVPSTAGATTGVVDIDSDELPEFTENTTENLRSALAADAPFTLFGAPDTEDVEITSEPAVSAPSQAAAAPLAPPTLGLFFSHESPYLRSLTQAAKLVADFDPLAWESEFFENRGEWNRNLRTRRRDALRTAKKMGKRRGE